MVAEEQFKRWEDDLRVVPPGGSVKKHYRGVMFAIVRQPTGHLCGYVKIPLGLTIDPEEIKVHGGITFEGDIKYLIGHFGGGNWIGFDCAHAFDFIPRDFPYRKFETYRDSAYVEDQCKKVIDQIKTA